VSDFTNVGNTDNKCHNFGKLEKGERKEEKQNMDLFHQIISLAGAFIQT